MSAENSEKSKDKKSSDVVQPNKEHETAADDKKDECQDGSLDATIKEMPPEIKRQVQSFMATFQSRPQINPLFEKFTEAHVDKYLDYIQRDDDNEYELRKSNRWFYLAYFVLGLVALSAAVIYILPKDKAFLEMILQILIALAGGIGAGYGLSKYRSKG